MDGSPQTRSPLLRNLFLFCVLGLLMAGCEDEPRSKERPFVVPEGWEIVDDRRNDWGEGHVLVRDESGRIRIIWTRHRDRHIPLDFGEVREPAPVVAGKTGPFPGQPVDFETLGVPMARLPDELFAPYPEPADASGWTDDERRRYRERVDRDHRESERVVLVTREGVPPEEYIRIRVFDGLGNLLLEQTKKGAFERVILNEDTGEKTFLVVREGLLRWIVVDYVTGTVLVDSQFGLPADTPIESVERVGNSVVVIQRWRNGAWIRVRIFATDGSLRHVMDIPGSYVTSATDDSEIKALVFRDGDDIYQDLIHVGNGTRTSGVTGLPQNPLRGTHAHLQVDRVGSQKRFVEVVFDAGRNETVVRILDDSGQTVATQVIPGRFRHVREREGKKVFIIDRNGSTDAVVLNLANGREENFRSVPGAFRRVSISADGTVTVETRSDRVSFSL